MMIKYQGDWVRKLEISNDYVVYLQESDYNLEAKK